MDAYPTVSLLDPARLDQIALRVWTKSARTDLSGRQFWARVTHYVDFIEREPRIGQFALVLGHTSADLMAFFLALVACGRLAAFFPPNSPLQDERYYFSQQKHSLDKINPSAICIFESQLAETIRQIDPSLGGRTITVPAAEIATMPAPGEPRAMAMLRARLECEQPIFVQHSSGTTGIKKAVGISGQALARQYDAYWPLIRQQAETDCLRIASWLPLYHDMGLIATFLLPALGGDTISIIDPFEWINTPGTLLEMIEADGADVCWLPNFAFRHFSRLRKALPTRNLASVKLWIDCSEPCRYADAVRFEQDFAAFGVRPGSVVGCYAMAETVFAVSQLSPGQQRALAVPHAVTVGTDMAASGALVVSEGTLVSGGHKLVLSSGPVLPGLQVRVRADGSDVPEGTYGEITIRGDFLFDGYRGMSRPDSAIGADGAFATGDLGTIIDGHLFIFGRLKEIIIVNGKNLFAGDVEDILNSVHGVKKGRVVAFGLDSDQTGSEELVVVAEHDPNAGVAAAETRASVNRAIAETLNVKPRDVRIVDERWLVKSTSGKITREDNRRKYLDHFRTSTAT